MPIPSLEDRGLIRVDSNARINGVLRHKHIYCSIDTAPEEILSIKNRLRTELKVEYGYVQQKRAPRMLNKSNQSEFDKLVNDYHQKQVDEYGYIKYKIENDGYVAGFVRTYNVNAMYKYNGYGRNKLNCATEQEVREWIENNPVEETE